MRNLLCCFCSILVFFGKTFSQDPKLPFLVYSPDRKIQVIFFSVDEPTSEFYHKICYQVIRQGKIVLDTSKTGFSSINTGSFCSSESIKSVSAISSIKESYRLISGKSSWINYTANEVLVSLSNTEGYSHFIRIWVFNDGFAIRYEFAQQKKSIESIIVKMENTSFKLPAACKVWAQPYDKPSKWTPGHENYFSNAALPEVGTAEGWCFPILVESVDQWMLISEAALNENYFAVHLQFDPAQNAYSIRQPEQADGGGYGDNIAVMHLPSVTPWRCVIISSDLQGILSSQMINNLNPPSLIKDVSWIKPGIASWSWWSENDSPKYYDSLRKYIDFSAAMHLPYFLVDANWNNMQGGNITALASYAKSKNVGLWLWYNPGGPNNIVTEEPRDALFSPEKRRETFAWLQKIGIRGIKVDFFQSDKQVIVQQYLSILKDAAEHKIMVNFHGCTLPRGWNRTYPNLLSMEAVCGAESYLFKDGFPAMAPIQNTILPFTRNAVGSMDYTPVAFSNKKFSHLTTTAHELALPVIFESGFLHLADSKEIYFAQPQFVLEYIQHLPVVWDEIKYIAGIPGKDPVLARRKNDLWYLAGINGEPISKSFSLNNFLRNRKIEVLALLEDDDQGSVKKTKPELIPENIQIKSYGGFVLLCKNKK